MPLQAVSANQHSPAQAVIDLQDPERNPDYRVVYSSATGATDVRNMAYMVRLGLWGIYVVDNISLSYVAKSVMWRSAFLASSQQQTSKPNAT
jgi:NTP hydrolase family protein